MARTVSVSIVIPAYGYCPHLPDLITRLFSGSVSPGEVIVSHSGPDDPGSIISGKFPEVVLLHTDQRLYAGAARNRGAEIASGDYLAFIDADVKPHKEWLAKLIATMDIDPNRFCVGSVGVAEAGGYWGMSTWLLEFNEQAPWRPAGVQTGGASCNMMVRAQDFSALEGFPEDFQPAEDTVLLYGLRQIGRQQWFASDARVDHYNHQGFAPFWRQQFKLGYHSALVRQKISLRGSMATRFRLFSLVIWMPKVVLITSRLIAAGPRGWLRAAYYLPGIVLGAWIWVAGFVKRVYGAAGHQE